MEAIGGQKRTDLWKWRGGPLGLVLWLGFVSPAASQTQLPEGKGKDLVESACTQCHGLGYIVNSKLPREDWERIVHDMVSRGAPLLEEEIEVVVDYLTQHFGKDETSGGAIKEPAAAKNSERRASVPYPFGTASANRRGARRWRFSPTFLVR